MKLETVKSFILTILIGISLLLSLGLWSQPDENPSISGGEVDTDIGGKEVTEEEIVEPSSIIFHRYSRHFGFTDPKKRQNLYEHMQSWMLSNFETIEANGPPTNDYQVELIFPDALPMQIVDELFTLNRDTYLPDWSFKRMFITFNQNMSSLNIQFLSVDGQQQGRATVNNADVFDLVWEYVTTGENLSEYVLFEETDLPIYIPKDPQEMTEQTLTVNNIETNKLVNALFSDPSVVSRSSIGEAYYSDGQRGMQVQNQGNSMVFTNPIDTNYERRNPLDLLKRSMRFINEHKGWTDEYNLDKIEQATNRLQYRMFYEGYPIFNNNNLSIIKQEWRNQELYEYQRPLYRISSPFVGDSVELQSGEDVIFLLTSEFNVANISDIQVGYRLEQRDRNYWTLDPAWYMNYNGNWQEIKFPNEIPLDKGGS